MIEESRRELIEEKIPRGLRKVYLAETRRFVKLLITQLQWYGVPYRVQETTKHNMPNMWARTYPGERQGNGLRKLRIQSTKRQSTTTLGHEVRYDHLSAL